MVVMASELGGNESYGDAHQTGSAPLCVFGKGQGLFRTGRYFRGKSPDTGTGDVDRVVQIREGGVELINPRVGAAEFQEAGRDTARVMVSAMRYMSLPASETNLGATGVNEPLSWLYK